MVLYLCQDGVPPLETKRPPKRWSHRLSKTCVLYVFQVRFSHSHRKYLVISEALKYPFRHDLWHLDMPLITF